MSIILQILFIFLLFAFLFNADKLYKLMQPVRRKIMYRINRYLLNKSFAAAKAKAETLKADNRKVYLMLWRGDWYAITKQGFKQMWHDVPAMKKRTIQEWEKTMIPA